nr:hypothetical protein [Alicyclobacillus sp.]
MLQNTGHKLVAGIPGHHRLNDIRFNGFLRNLYHRPATAVFPLVNGMATSVVAFVLRLLVTHHVPTAAQAPEHNFSLGVDTRKQIGASIGSWNEGTRSSLLPQSRSQLYFLHAQYGRMGILYHNPLIFRLELSFRLAQYFVFLVLPVPDGDAGCAEQSIPTEDLMQS